MINTSDSDPNFNIRFATSNVILPSYNQNPRKRRRTLISDDETGATCSSSKRPKPVKKSNPNAPKITRPCTECGKQFWSWKALFGHMRCHPERQWRGMNPPLTHQRGTSASWVSEEDLVVASCLLMLASGGVEYCGVTKYDLPVPPSQDKGKSVKFVNHQCNICFKTFSSGQALGGHMRCHWERDDQEQKQDPTASDLNVPAPFSSPECSLDLRLRL